MSPPPKGSASCLSCPSLIDSGQRQKLAIGTSSGAPMCGRFLRVLSQPNQPRDVATRVLADTAKGCSSYGQRVNITPLSETSYPLFQVGIDALAPTPTTNDTMTKPSCTSCANYVNPVTVARHTGWSLPLCRAQGALMLPEREGYANNCGKFVVQIGPRPTNPLAGMSWLPIYSHSYGTIDPVVEFKKATSNVVEAEDYETDRPVGPKAAAAGVRAWYRIVDPLGYGADVYLPVFGPNAHTIDKDGVRSPLFTERERELIPHHTDDTRPHIYADHSGILYRFAVLWMKLDMTPAAWGQGGTGKTEIGRYLAWRMGLPYNRISIHGSTEVDDLAGKVLFKGNETVPHYGALSTAWIRPGIITLDEPNTGPNDVWQLIRPLTDNSKTLLLPMLNDERLARNDYCFFYMAMNPAWDPRNSGTQDVADADNSRLAHIWFSLPPRPLEEEIIRQNCGLDGYVLPGDYMDAVMKTAADLRDASSDGRVGTTWGVRHNIKVARNLQFFPAQLSYRLAAGDAMDPQQLEQLMSIVRDHFGG